MIVDPDTNTIIDHIKAAKPNRQALAITSDGERFVWNCERSMSLIVQWDVETRTKMCEYQCNVERPLDQNLYAEVGSLLRNSASFSSLDQSSIVEDSVFTENSRNNDTSTQHSEMDTVSNSSYDEDHFRIRTKSIQKEEKSIFLMKLSRTKSAATDIQKIPGKKVVDIEVKARSKSDEFNLPGLSCSPSKGLSQSSSKGLSQSPNKGFMNQLSAVQEGVSENIIQGNTGFIQRTIRKKPSLMFPNQSVKKKSRRDKDYVPSELLSNSLPRPRSSVVKGTPIRVTSMKYIKGALWVGRTSGDILIMNVVKSSSDSVFEGEQADIPCGKVITVLGDDKIRPLGGFNRTVNNLIEFKPDKLLALVRFDTKPPNRSPNIRPNNSKIPENFQMLKFNTWTPERIVKFREKFAND